MRLVENPRFQAGCVAALALCFGLWGLGWQLPSRERLSWVLPPGADTPEARASLEESWRRMHASLGEDLMIASQDATSFKGLQAAPSGWVRPPEVLVNSVRSFYLRSAFDDEQTFLILFSKMRPRELDFRPRMYLYGGGYLYPLGAWMGGCALLGLGHLSHRLADYLAHPEWLAGLYLSGRLFSTFAWLLGGLYLLFLGRKFVGKIEGFAAALLYALSPALITQAHVIKQHTLWPLWAMASCHACLLLIENGSLRLYALAGLAAGLSAGTFHLAAVCCLFPAAAALLRLDARRRFDIPGLALAALCSVAGFLLVNPYWIPDFSTVRAEMAVNAGYTRFSLWALILFLSRHLRLAMTWPVELACAAGLVLAWRRGDARLRLIGLFFLVSLTPVLVSIAAFQERGMRYAIMAVPLGGLLAARAFESIPRRRTRGWVYAAVFLHLLLSAATAANNFSKAGGPGSTYRLAGLWLEGRVRPGERVGLWDLPRPFNAPYCRLDRFNWVFLDWRDAERLSSADLPDWIVLFQPRLFRRPQALAVLKGYEKSASFERPWLVPWLRVHWSETSANPVFEIYRRREGGGKR
jgi:hypothetical protein